MVGKHSSFINLSMYSLIYKLTRQVSVFLTGVAFICLKRVSSNLKRNSFSISRLAPALAYCDCLKQRMSNMSFYWIINFRHSTQNPISLAFPFEQLEHHLQL